jgi:vancomycin resistance protein YoaR
MGAMEPQAEQSAPASPAEPFLPVRRRFGWLRKLAITAVVIVILTIIGFALVYGGKIYPGVTVDGVYLGGLNQADAIAAVNTQIANYKLEAIPINAAGTSSSIAPFSLNLSYDVNGAVALALKQGHQGDFWQQAYDETRAILGRPTAIAMYSYDDSLLTPYLDDYGQAINTMVQNASFNVSGNSVTVNAGSDGARLDIGAMVIVFKNRLSNLDNSSITVPSDPVHPLIDTAALEAVRAQAATYLSGSLTLTAAGQTFVATTDDISGWLSLNRVVTGNFDVTHNIADFTPAIQPVHLSLDDAKITAYVASLAAKTDRAAVNATLAMDNGALTVATPSQTGQALNQPATVKSIEAALASSTASRNLALPVTTTQPDVSENNLSSLGITGLLSEGETSFAPSTADRIINVRVGASKFNGILIKPGDTFSFNTILGPVGPEEGYTSQPVILQNTIQNEFGGGLCQVSSTAFRAALLAGLPIVARQNHSFVVSYYTAPYSVPGLDATIYLPAPDFKFTNDTSSYILIETTLDAHAQTLKFDFYGTKTKQGVIRGPYYVTGSSDINQPSHTIFYRDVEDMSGNVIKTDTFNSYYQAANAFTNVANTKEFQN